MGDAIPVCSSPLNMPRIVAELPSARHHGCAIIIDLQQFDRITGLIGLVAIAISALGLLVGGIGVMNIMLVSVTERTREIGVRKAMGARRRHILVQFLIEAITLSLLGGLLGVLLGVGASRLVAVFADFKAIVSTGSILLAFGVSFVIGVTFGFYPACKAAALDPIDALRYE